MNQQAQELNNSIQKASPSVFEMLSQKGKEIYYPKEGILAQSDEAKNADINATIGISTEDNGTPMHFPFMDEVIKLEPSKIYPYSSSFGNPQLREIWKKHIEKVNELNTETSMPIVAGGITHSLSVAGFLFINEGDTVLIHDKFWGNYKLIFENQFGAKISSYNTFKNDKFDTESLKSEIEKAEDKVILLFNFPNNPSGYTPSESEMEEIKNVIMEQCNNGKKIVAIIDDAYFGLFYDETSAKTSLLSYLADLHENLVIIKADGATKEELAWGLRVGFITFNSKNFTKETYEAMELKAAGAVRASISNASTLSQNVVLSIMNHPEYQSQKDNTFEILKKRYLKVKEILKEKTDYQKFFKALPFNSGYFMCIELNNTLNAEAVRQTLLKSYNTGVISQGNLLRIAFSSVPESRIEELFENIFKACAD